MTLERGARTLRVRKWTLRWLAVELALAIVALGYLAVGLSVLVGIYIGEVAGLMVGSILTFGLLLPEAWLIYTAIGLPRDVWHS